MRFSIYFFFLILLLSACSVVKPSSKYSFSEGIYHMKLSGKATQKTYVQYLEDSLKLYYLPKKLPDEVILQTFPTETLPFPSEKTFSLPQKQIFRRNSFDLDLVTVPFKFRPAVPDFPIQFNTNFNGSVFVGYRIDKFSLQYRKNEIGLYKKILRHHGYSFGLFGGLGATAMNPSVTRNQVQVEYDGLITGKGLAGILAIDNLTFGLGVGFDHLLDPNRTVWIYQGKPWVGLILGLNLN